MYEESAAGPRAALGLVRGAVLLAPLLVTCFALLGCVAQQKASSSTDSTQEEEQSQEGSETKAESQRKDSPQNTNPSRDKQDRKAKPSVRCSETEPPGSHKRL
jgi:hypothetical protein